MCGQQPAIHVECGTSDVPREVRDQKQCSLGDIIRLATMPHGNEASCIGIDTLWGVIETGRDNVAGSDSVDSDLMRCPLHGHGLHQTDQPRLCCTIGTAHWANPLSVN